MVAGTSMTWKRWIFFNYFFGTTLTCVNCIRSQRGTLFGHLCFLSKRGAMLTSSPCYNFLMQSPMQRSLHSNVKAVSSSWVHVAVISQRFWNFTTNLTAPKSRGDSCVVASIWRRLGWSQRQQADAPCTREAAILILHCHMRWTPARIVMVHLNL